MSLDKEDGATLSDISSAGKSSMAYLIMLSDLTLPLLLTVLQQSESSSDVKPPDVVSQQGWGQRVAGGANEGPGCSDGPPSVVLLDGLHSLAEAEKLFDELTQEKLQVG